LKGLRILLAEDEPVLSRILARELVARGHHVESRSSGVEARDLLARQPFDVAILDFQLPDLEGSEIVRGLIREGRPRVLFLTGYPVTAVAGRVVVEKARVLSKPTDLMSLIRAVEDGNE